jgi:hypothetical protein
LNRTTTSLYALIVIGFLSFILLTIVENNQHIYQVFINSFNSDYFKEVSAGKEDEEEKSEEDSVEQKICNKLLQSETCEKMKKDEPTEKEELTEEEIKAEAIINRYLEPVESEKKSIDNNIVSQSAEEQLSTSLNQSSLNNPNVSTNTQNLNNLNQLQLVDLIASTISNANNIDKNKVTQLLNDFIEPTKANGGNVIESLKKIVGIILNDPSGIVANNIINIVKTK